jgi:serine/threonine protein kinase
MSLTIGGSLGPYVILGPLGKGGMGEVYRARDSRLERDVAIKIVREDGADDDARARFEREAKLLAALNHPSIATIHGLEEGDGQRFLVMELVPGDTLAELLHRGRLPTYRILDIAQQIAGALEAAHARGIIHRDLKPANVKVTPAGKVKLLDFGLAKALDRAPGTNSASTVSHDLTGPGAILGTPAYMSPEQARGQVVDARTDVWAFGCILYEMLSGERPFTAPTSVDLIVAILERQPNWNAFPAETHARFAQLVQNCLQKNATNRPADMAKVGRELELVLAEMRRPGKTVAPTRTYIPMAIAVKELTKPEDDPPTVLEAPSTTKRNRPPRKPTAKTPTWVWVLIVLLVAFCGSGYGVVSVFENFWRNSPFAPAPANTVAILPFDAGDPFSKDGENLAAAINGNLVKQAPELRVTAHAAAVNHRDPKMAGAFLHIRWAVAGKIERNGKDLAIHAELIDVKTQVAVWTERVPAKSATDPDAARAIAGKVRQRLAMVK